MGPPKIECFFSLQEELVPLIYSSNPGDRAGLVVENLVRDMGCDAKSGHPGYASSAQIVNAPSGYPGELVELTFRTTELVKWLGSKDREYVRPSLHSALQHGDRLL